MFRDFQCLFAGNDGLSQWRVGEAGGNCINTNSSRGIGCGCGANHRFDAAFGRGDCFVVGDAGLGGCGAEE